MKDSKGKKITIGDRVKVIWNFDNKIHTGEITKINDNFVEIDIFTRKISIRDRTKIEKIQPQRP